MIETGAAVLGSGRPTTAEVRKVAGGAAGFAAVLGALDAFVGSGGGLMGLVLVVVLVGVVTLGVFYWGVPWALGLEEPGASVVAVVTSLLALLTVVIFWSGLPPVLAAAGILLGWTQRSVVEGRFYAQAAIVLGAAALVLDVVWVVNDLL